MEIHVFRNDAIYGSMKWLECMVYSMAIWYTDDVMIGDDHNIAFQGQRSRHSSDDLMI